MNRRAWATISVVVTSLAVCAVPALQALGGSAGVAGQRPLIRLREGTSTNWSGYAAFGGAGAFTSVRASWTQPAVTCGTTNAYSSYWAGIDGYNTSTVEQLGTEADCVSGAPRYYAWFEMYPHPSFVISGFTVRPSDTYTASVVAQGRGSYVLSLKDTTTGASFSTVQKLNSARGASAEVVVEAPYSGGVLPLANFATASFTGSAANGVPIGAFAPNLDPITMDNPAGMKATPSSLDSTGQNFSVTWSAH
jgi:hypothetical protein